MKKISKSNKIQPTALYCQKDETKALRELLTKVGDKWSILLVVVLSRSPDSRARFSTLLKQVEGISQRMLTTTLRNLERDGFILREVFPEVPPRVEYELTNLGKSLLDPMKGLVDWIMGNWRDIKKARERYEGRSLRR